MTASPASLTVVILTKDEERHIGRAIQSVLPIAERIVVVDSGSQDRTRTIASGLGAEIHDHPWRNYAEQFQWALDHCGIASDWTMRLDADEWIGPDLAAKLPGLLGNLDPDVRALSLDRRHHFMGRWIRYGGRFPLRLLRIWRTGEGWIEQRWMDEHIVIESGRVLHVDGTFVDENDHGLGFFIDKHNGYATREALDALIEKYALFASAETDAGIGTAQAKRTRRVKRRWYNRLPTGVGPLLYFLYRYILRLGFLDGRAGLIYHVLQGFWYRFLVDAKRLELEQAMVAAADDGERIAILTRETGHDLRGFVQSQGAARGSDDAL